jgi:tRNA1(Val) A37 N6-methylase TrmN6
VLDGIPESEKWDLVVGNPPHYWTGSEAVYKNEIRKYDPNLRIHRKFYETIAKHLKPNGSIVMQENSRATRMDDFKPMIEENGLKVFEVFTARPLTFAKCIMSGRNPIRCVLQMRNERFRKSGMYFMWSQVK